MPEYVECAVHNYGGPWPCPDCDLSPKPVVEPEYILERQARMMARELEAKLAATDCVEASEKATSYPTASANDRQVGGSHYAGSYQHWDFVHDLNLDYWQACASKYVTRWRKKNGLEDLAKAPHYMEKRKELKRSSGGVSLSFIFEKTLKLAQANGLDAYDIEAIVAICMGMNDDAVKLINVISERAATPDRLVR